MSEKYPNYYSIAGNPNGELLLRERPDGPVSVLRGSGFATVLIPEIHVHIPRGQVVADAFKLSCARNLRIDRLVVTADNPADITENSFDANNECENVGIGEAHLQQGRQNSVTMKGGCQLMGINRLFIQGNGGNCDGEFGNYSEQSSKLTADVRIGQVECDDGRRPFRYRVGWAKNISIEDGATDYQRMMSLAVRYYCALKYRKPPAVFFS